jgi:hypothetical protein
VGGRTDKGHHPGAGGDPGQGKGDRRPVCGPYPRSSRRRNVIAAGISRHTYTFVHPRILNSSDRLGFCYIKFLAFVNS